MSNNFKMFILIVIHQSSVNFPFYYLLYTLFNTYIYYSFVPSCLYNIYIGIHSFRVYAQCTHRRGISFNHARVYFD